MPDIYVTGENFCNLCTNRGGKSGHECEMQKAESGLREERMKKDLKEGTVQHSLIPITKCTLVQERSSLLGKPINSQENGLGIGKEFSDVEP